MEDLVTGRDLAGRLKPPVVLLDLDGTLLDSGDQVAEVAAFALNHLGLDGAPHEVLRRRTGESVEALFQEIADAKTRRTLIEIFRTRLAEIAGGRDQVMPGVFAGLRELRSKGWRLGVATNKPTRLAEAVLARSELLEMLDHVQGADGLAHKPAPDILLAASHALDGPAKWLVGDTTIDVLAGRSAGIGTIAVCGGSHTREELASVSPDVIVTDFGDAVAAILDRSGGRDELQ